MYVCGGCGADTVINYYPCRQCAMWPCFCGQNIQGLAFCRDCYRRDPHPEEPR